VLSEQQFLYAYLLTFRSQWIKKELLRSRSVDSVRGGASSLKELAPIISRGFLKGPGPTSTVSGKGQLKKQNPNADNS